MAHIVAYLTFNGQAREAMEFYKTTLGGDLQVMPFSDMPPSEGMQITEETKDRVMHANLADNKGLHLMASDSMPGYEVVNGSSVSLSLHAADIPEAEKLFNGLSDGGQITMPLAETFWATRFGMFTDRFGIPWMVNCDKPQH